MLIRVPRTWAVASLRWSYREQAGMIPIYIGTASSSRTKRATRLRYIP